MGKLHWYKRDPDAALAGMAELTLAERGAYNSIIDLLYSRGGNVPDDDVLVARMIGCHWREWRAMKARLIERGKVRLEGGKITANRVQEALKEAADFSQDQRRRAAKRWHKSEKDNEINDPAMPPGNASTTTTTTTTTTRLEDPPIAPPKGGATEEPANGKSRRKRETAGTRLDPAWLPSPEDRAYAESLGLNPDITGEEFRNFWIGVPGARGRKLDWPATFRNRCIQLAGATRRGPNGHAGGNGSGFQEGGSGLVAAARRVARRRGLVLS